MPKLKFVPAEKSVVKSPEELKREKERAEEQQRKIEEQREEEKEREAAKLRKEVASLTEKVEKFYGECQSQYSLDASSEQFGEILKKQAGREGSIKDLDSIVQKGGDPFDYYRMVENIVVRQVATSLLNAKNPGWKNSNEQMDFSQEEKDAYVKTLQNIMNYRKQVDKNTLPIQDVVRAFGVDGVGQTKVHNSTETILTTTQVAAMDIKTMLNPESNEMEQEQPKPKEYEAAPKKVAAPKPKPKSKMGRDIY